MFIFHWHFYQSLNFVVFKLEMFIYLTVALQCYDLFKKIKQNFTFQTNNNWRKLHVLFHSNYCHIDSYTNCGPHLKEAEMSTVDQYSQVYVTQLM